MHVSNKSRILSTATPAPQPASSLQDLPAEVIQVIGIALRAGRDMGALAAMAGCCKALRAACEPLLAPRAYYAAPLQAAREAGQDQARLSGTFALLEKFRDRIGFWDWTLHTGHLQRCRQGDGPLCNLAAITVLPPDSRLRSELLHSLTDEQLEEAINRLEALERKPGTALALLFAAARGGIMLIESRLPEVSGRLRTLAGRLVCAYCTASKDALLGELAKLQAQPVMQFTAPCFHFGQLLNLFIHAHAWALFRSKRHSQTLLDLCDAHINGSAKLDPEFAARLAKVLIPVLAGAQGQSARTRTRAERLCKRCRRALADAERRKEPAMTATAAWLDTAMKSAGFTLK